MTKDCFKILSIDGGGIKGLYSARILQKLEADLQSSHNDPSLRLVDYFDLVCGTSTGGLIALAISLRKPMEEICQFYEKYGRRIFPASNSGYRKFKQVLFRGKYSDKHLKEAVHTFFGDRRIGDSHCLLCIPSYDFTHGTYALFRYDHSEGNLSRHNDLLYSDVALSTSAAPTYFPLAEVGGEYGAQYLDGGVWANNPTMVGFTEGVRYFVGEGRAYHRMAIMSVASLNVSKGQAPQLKRARSFLNWANDLFDLSLIGQSEFCDIFMKTMVGNARFPLDYVRIPSAEISADQIPYIALDNASEKSLNLMNQFAEHMYHRFKDDDVIKGMLSEKKTYLTKS